MAFFFKGILLGMIVCTAPGPILTIIFKEGLKRGFRFALRFGLGVAVVDVLYCLLAFIGVTPLLSSFPAFIPAMWLLGGGIFLTIGVVDLLKMIRSRGVIVEPKKYRDLDYSHPFKRGLLISLFNPGAVLFWISVSGAFVHFQGGASLLFITGVALGSPLFFLLLAYLISHLREKMTEKFLYYLTLIAGLILIVVGLYFFYRFSILL